MSLLAKRSIGKKEAPGGILVISKEAEKAKLANPKVINATIGMLNDEEDEFLSFKVVDEATKELQQKDKYAYSTTQGNPDFLEAIKKWVFRSHYDEILQKMKCQVIATPGGSGAIGNVFSNYLNQGDKVLLPNYMWGIYKQYAREVEAGFETYSLFNEKNEFNFKDLESKALALKKTQGRVVLVINDPCHNPTGYSMKYEEWIEMVDFINSISRDGTPCVLLYDMAYIDYDIRGLEASRNNIKLFTNFNENVMTVLAFSGSKTLGLYGLRIGAMVALCKNEANINEFYDACIYSSRAKWSTASNLGMNIISHIFNNKELFKMFEAELVGVREVMKERSLAFLESAKEVDLPILPYKSGFFVTVLCDNPMQSYKELVKKDCYVVPLENGLRVAICAVNVEEARILPALIKSVL